MDPSFFWTTTMGEELGLQLTFTTPCSSSSWMCAFTMVEASDSTAEPVHHTVRGFHVQLSQCILTPLPCDWKLPYTSEVKTWPTPVMLGQEMSAWPDRWQVVASTHWIKATGPCLPSSSRKPMCLFRGHTSIICRDGNREPVLVKVPSGPIPWNR